jgi:tetratricopeptide (TPR) repeat protein
MQHIKKYGPIVLCYLVVIVFSIKNFKEPDLWWQIRTGEYIIEHKAVPTQDVFSFTYEGTPWINIKWGFELIAAGISNTIGFEYVFLMQAVFSCLILFFLLKTARLLLKKHGLNNDVSETLLPFLVLLFLIGISYRIIGRPEMISHLFTAIFVFVLLRYQQAQTKLIFILIPLQLIWTNTHEAFATGLVVLAIFTTGAWVDYFLIKNEGGIKKATTISLVTVCSFLIILINPNGIEIIKSPLSIFKQVYANKYTTELLGIDSYFYWKKEAYIAIVMLSVIMLGILFNLSRKKPFIEQIVQQYGAATIALLIIFTYLATTAYRNIIFIEIIAFPLFAVFFCQLLGKYKHKKWINSTVHVMPYLALLAGVLLYAGIVSNKYYELAGANDRFGLEILTTNNPEGAAAYIEQHHLADKKGFCDYAVSAYLLKRLEPSYKSFIDMRDLDIFPVSFFNQFAEATVYPETFNKLDSQYHFDYAVLYRNQFSTLHQYLYNSPTYSLVFADAVACIYQKQSIKYNTTVFSSCKPLPQSISARILNKVFNSFYHTYDYASIDRNVVAANYYTMVGNTLLAKQYANTSTAKNKSSVYELLANMYISEINKDTTQASQAMRVDSAMYYAKKSLKEDPNNSSAYFDLGILSYRNRYFKEAIKHFEKAISLGNNESELFIYTAESYKALANQSGSSQNKFIESAIDNYLQGERISPGNPITIANLGFLYFRIEDCDHAIYYLDQVKDYPGLSETSRQDAKDCLKKCNQ